MISKLNEFLKTFAVVTYIFCKTTNLCVNLKSFTFFHSLNKEMFRNANIFKQRRDIFRVGWVQLFAKLPKPSPLTPLPKVPPNTPPDCMITMY